MDADSVFHFHFAQIVQLRLPLAVLLEILGDALRQQNVSGVAAIHHALRDVDPDAGGVGPPVHVDHRAHRPAVHAHAHLQFGMCLQSAMNFQRAFHRLLRTLIEDQRHSIAGRDFYQSIRRFRPFEFVRAANNLIELLNQRVLLVRQQLGVTDNVDEQDMDDLQLDFLFDLGGHARRTPPIFWAKKIPFSSLRGRKKPQVGGAVPPPPGAGAINPP